jgi:hypothetical protein
MSHRGGQPLLRRRLAGYPGKLFVGSANGPNGGVRQGKYMMLLLHSAMTFRYQDCGTWEWVY